MLFFRLQCAKKASRLGCTAQDERGEIAMPDVIEIAKDHRARLTYEIDKLDGFIEMAEQLIRSSQPEPDEAPETEREPVEAKDKEVAEPVNAEPEWPAREPADEEDVLDEGLPARELKAEEQVLNLLAREKISAAERKGIFRRAPS
jgi:hypothetical protein